MNAAPKVAQPPQDTSELPASLACAAMLPRRALSLRVPAACAVPAHWTHVTVCSAGTMWQLVHVRETLIVIACRIIVLRQAKQVLD